MSRHISAHRATTKYFSNSFVFKTNIEKEGLPRGSTPALETSAQRLVGKPTHLPHEHVRSLLRIIEHLKRHGLGWDPATLASLDFGRVQLFSQDIDKGGYFSKCLVNCPLEHSKRNLLFIARPI